MAKLMEHREFVTLMNDARDYYKLQLEGIADIENPIAKYITNKPLAKIPEGLKAIAEELRDDELRNISLIEKEVIEAKEEVQSSSDMDRFKGKMTKLRDKTKKKALKKIDETFAKLIDYGKSHPDEQELIFSLRI